MEPVSVGLITGTLLAGAASAAKDVGTQAVKDGYNGLKTLIQGWFKEKEQSEGEMALTNVEEKPELWKPVLEDSLVATKAVGNEEIIRAVQVLIEAMKETPEGKETLSKYNITDSEVGAIGDHMNIHGGIKVGGSK